MAIFLRYGRLLLQRLRAVLRGGTGNDGFQSDFKQVERIKGPWHWQLTLATLLIVGALSFSMAYLTKGVEERSPLLMGLIFAVPMAAMFLASLFMEYRTSAMTPSFLRKTQTIIATVAVLATFGVGVLCDWLYLYGFVEPIDRKTVFVLDKSASMRGTRNDDMVKAMDQIIEAMDKTEEVGLVLFHDSVCKESAIALLSSNADLIKQEIANTAADGGSTSFYAGMTGALRLFEEKTSAAGKATENKQETVFQIIFLTDGEDPFFDEYEKGIKTRCQAMDVTVHGIAFSHDGKLDVMTDLISATGGTIVNAANAEELVEVLFKLTKHDDDLLRAQNGSANLMSGIMLVLEGLVIGLGLWLMLSMQGQFRVQAVLSPVMGVMSFVLLKYAGFNMEQEYWWIIEGMAFTLLGVVFMTKNRLLNRNDGTKKPAEPTGNSAQIPDFDF